LTNVPLISGLSELASSYDAFLLDAWGVLHDGRTLYPGTLDCLKNLKDAGKRSLVLSNSSRRNPFIEEHILGLGIPQGYIEQAVTSGEITWNALKTGRFGSDCYYIGPVHNPGLTDDLDINMVPNLAQASFVLATGVVNDSDPLSIYEETLVEAARFHLPLVCANPDVTVIHDGSRKVCAGAMAARYQQLGGAVHLFGKPHRPIYEASLTALGNVPKDRVLAIGDSFHTDISGAIAAGIDCVLIAGGIHYDDLGGTSPSDKQLQELCQLKKLYPTAALPLLQW